MNLSNRVKVVADFVDTAEYLTGADIFCFPAQNEAMGTPLLEALVAGTPTVANGNEPSFGEWIVDGNNGFLIELDAGKWATAIQKLAEFDSDKKKQISEAITARVSSDVIDDHYFRLLTELTNTPVESTLNVEQVLSS